MKWKRKQRSKKLKTLAFFGSASLIGAVIYIVIAGFTYTAAAVIGVATVLLSAPGAIAGDGIVDVVVSFLEMALEGIVVVFDVIAGLISGIFS